MWISIASSSLINGAEHLSVRVIVGFNLLMYMLLIFAREETKDVDRLENGWMLCVLSLFHGIGQPATC